MRRLILTEFRTERAVPLDREERDGLQRLHPGLGMTPAAGLEGAYDLTPDQHIGLIALPRLAVEIRPKVAMSSVLFLLSYAVSAVDWLEHEPDLAEDAGLTELVALILARATERATRRGLLTGYVAIEELLPAPRGRVLFDEQIRRRLGHFPPVEVRHDLFTTDVLENRLLLAALTHLQRLPLRDPGARREIARAERLFGSVSLERYRPGLVPRVRFNQLNRHYEGAVQLARLVLESCSLDLGSGGTRGAAFLVDMNRVFEEFVRTALREALCVDEQAWPDRPQRVWLDEASFVPMWPDLCLIEGGKIVWVGDAKYKRLAGDVFRHTDLYQMLAYTTALALPCGSLIYAAADDARGAEHVVRNCGKRIHVTALDLETGPRGLLAQVNALARDIAAAARD